MKLLVNNKECSFLGLTSQESLDQYYPFYQISVPAQIKTNKIQLQDKSTDTYYILRGELQKTVYIYTIVHESIYQILNRTYPSYTGTTTIQGLLSTLSIKNDITSSTGQVLWRVPKYRFTRLLEYLTKFTVVSKGGAPKYFLDLNGVLHLYDLRQILSRDNPTKITSFGLESEYMVSDWILRDTGEINIYDGSKRPNKFVIESNAGLASSFINDTTGSEVSLYKRWLTTDYYLKKYTAHRVIISDGADALSVGELVSLDDAATFVVYSRQATIPVNDEPAQVSYTLVSAV